MKEGGRGPLLAHVVDLNKAEACRFLGSPTAKTHCRLSITNPQPFCLLQCLYAGVLRGTGRQAFGAVVNAVMYYAIGLPLGVVLTFLVGMGIMGTWCGGRGEGLVIVDALTRPRILQASG